jgi:hypothetical protein
MPIMSPTRLLKIQPYSPAILGLVWIVILVASTACSAASPRPVVSPTLPVPATPVPAVADTPAPSAAPSPTPFALEVNLTVHALCNAPWKADALENSCPQVLALYPNSSELVALSTLPADQWPAYPVWVLAYDPATDCIYVREADGQAGWTNLSAVLDAAQIEIITRFAPRWQG